MFGKGQKVRIYAEETIPVDKVVSREYRATFRADLAKIRSCLLYILQVVKISIQKYTLRGGSYITMKSILKVLVSRCMRSPCYTESVYFPNVVVEYFLASVYGTLR
jgi:hypothetical protein